ncbi:MAG TPA: phosphatase PAP2 family protein [Rhizomicrobium sp.]|jgi:membrane-associated phospholipid phosphatase|nr:phosphatase PAP2 family protein [Rhizomicrobium sp.]
MIRTSCCGALALLLALAPLLALPGTALAAPLSSRQKAIETVGTGVSIALPVIAAGITLYKHDRKGLFELAAETVLTVGTAYALKNIVRERRPDGSDWQSFPSDTTALSASGSTYLWRRYGWEYGLPAFAASQFVSYSRVQADKHHWYDTLASSAIAAGYGLIVTDRFRRRTRITTELDPAPDGAVVRFSYNW